MLYKSRPSTGAAFSCLLPTMAFQARYLYGMAKSRVFYLFFFSLCFSAAAGFAQQVPVQYGRITVQVSELWSKRMQQEKMILDNHNVRGEIPATLTLFPFQQTTEAAKSHAALAFKKYLAASDTAAMPRPKRFYTEDAVPFFSFAMEKTNSKTPGYAALYVYSTEQGYQAMMLETNNQVDFRKIQPEWMQVLQTVRMK
jgi:hypothetical protein